MCRYCALLVLTALGVLAVSAETQQAAEGLKYGQRVARQEAVEESGDVQEAESEYRLQDTRSRRTNRQRSQQDDTSEGASSYSSVIMHSQEQPASSTNLQYKNIRSKVVKGRPKTVRQNFRESSVPNYKQYKPIRQGDQPSLPQQQSQVPSEQFVQEVHPSVMQRLMKQQPQTFDISSTKESEDFDPGQSEHNGALEESSESNHDISKRPIYVPNRVSVQNPSGDSSFNVGYSIGFGNGFAHRPKAGVVDPPVSYRQSKGLSYPTSFQSTPVNVHVEGKNSVWKNMGSGVEMSQNIDSEPKHISAFSSGNNDYDRYSSGSVINQPIFFRESFDIPTEGRNTFDHNYALQQSNPFDFSNAIDPDKNLPQSPQQSSDDEESQLSYHESFPRQAFPSYFEGFPKPTHTPQVESTMKQSLPSFVDLAQQRERASQPPHSVSGVTSNGERLNYDGFKFDTPSFERPSFVPTRMGPFRVSHPVTIVGKPKPIDFFKSSPINGKQAYNIKPFSNNDFNSNNADHGSNFEFSSMPMTQQMYDPSARAAPIGMVQAILVPVNSPIPSYPQQPGVPVAGNGYPSFFGQPIGYVNIPQKVEENPPHKEEFDQSEFETDGPSEAQELSPYFKKPPVKMVRGQYSGKHPKMEGKYQLHRSTQPRLRMEDQQDFRHSLKYKRLFSTESPELSLAEVKPTSHNPAVDMSAATSHPPRLYRSRPILIVKRS